MSLAQKCQVCTGADIHIVSGIRVGVALIAIWHSASEAFDLSAEPGRSEAFDQNGRCSSLTDK